MAVADLVGIPREVVLDSLRNAKPDPGVTVIESFDINGKALTWVNLFAVNDRESVIKLIKDVKEHYYKDNQANVCILNQREDRPDRANQFLDIATKDLDFDLVVTAGAYERQASSFLKKKKRST